jgi:hypothetical protein
MTEQVTVKTGFKKLPDSDALALAGTVLKGVFVDKVIAAAPPFDEATLQTAMDDLKGAIAAQAQAGGGTVVTAAKKKKRNVLDALLRKLAHYVQANCNDDAQLVVKTGFQAKTASVKSQTQLDKATILGVDNVHTRQLAVNAKKVAHAKLYEVQTAIVSANNSTGSFQSAGVFSKARSMTITGLTPGTTYAIQVRALGGATGSGDWSDTVTRICM